MGKVQAQGSAACPLCGRAMGKADVGSGKTAICPDCVALLARAVREQPELLRELWAVQHLRQLRFGYDVARRCRRRLAGGAGRQTLPHHRP